MKNGIDYAQIGKRIQQSRQACGLTQEKLAVLCQLSAAHIGHIERGTRIPSFETIVHISEALHISLDSLVLGSNQEPQVVLTQIGSILKTKSKSQVSAYLSVIQALLEKIDDI